MFSLFRDRPRIWDVKKTSPFAAKSAIVFFWDHFAKFVFCPILHRKFLQNEGTNHTYIFKLSKLRSGHENGGFGRCRYVSALFSFPPTDTQVIARHKTSGSGLVGFRISLTRQGLKPGSMVNSPATVVAEAVQTVAAAVVEEAIVRARERVRRMRIRRWGCQCRRDSLWPMQLLLGGEISRLLLFLVLIFIRHFGIVGVWCTCYYE